MSRRDLISIVIPCYNAAATVRATIESALAQDIEREIIVVDDGSTDASPDVLATFGDRIRVHRTINRGVSAARDTGTALARGAYLQYLDSDDLLMPGTLRCRLDALRHELADVAHTDWQKLECTADNAFRPGDIMCPDPQLIAEDAEAATASSKFWAPPAALLYRRAIVDRIGGWHEQLPVIQDARFLFEAAAAGARFVYVPGIGAQYRVLHNSLSRRNAGRFIADCCRNTSEIEDFWRAGGTLTPHRIRCLQSMWRMVAISSLTQGYAPFEEAYRALSRVGHTTPLLDTGAVLRRLIGRTRAAAAMRAAMGARSLLRSAASVCSRSAQSELV